MEEKWKFRFNAGQVSISRVNVRDAAEPVPHQKKGSAIMANTLRREKY